MLFGLGELAATFTNWKTERGLWMLAVLYFLIKGPIYAFFVIDQVQRLVDGKAQLLTLETIDIAIGSTILGFTVRFLWAVCQYNRTIRTSFVPIDNHDSLNPDINDAEPL